MRAEPPEGAWLPLRRRGRQHDEGFRRRGMAPHYYLVFSYLHSDVQMRNVCAVMHCALRLRNAFWRFEVRDGTNFPNGGGDSGADGAMLLGPPWRTCPASLRPLRCRRRDADRPAT